MKKMPPLIKLSTALDYFFCRNKLINAIFYRKKKKNKYDAVVPQGTIWLLIVIQKIGEDL